MSPYLENYEQKHSIWKTMKQIRMIKKYLVMAIVRYCKSPLKTLAAKFVQCSHRKLIMKKLRRDNSYLSDKAKILLYCKKAVQLMTHACGLLKTKPVKPIHHTRPTYSPYVALTSSSSDSSCNFRCRIFSAWSSAGVRFLSCCIRAFSSLNNLCRCKNEH